MNKPKTKIGDCLFGMPVVAYSDKKYANGAKALVLLCDCGNRFETTHSLISKKMYKCCAKCTPPSNLKHGNAGTKEYKHWEYINSRCFNSKDKRWQKYGGNGIISEFRYDFDAFLKEIGEYPQDGKHYSVDRIDNTKGYVKGNIRWATAAQQARNRGKASVNTSGVTGVTWQEVSGKLYARAYWTEEGKQHRMSFSVKEYGIMEAFAMAVHTRKMKIQELNTLGYGYTEGHGE